MGQLEIMFGDLVKFQHCNPCLPTSDEGPRALEDWQLNRELGFAGGSHLATSNRHSVSRKALPHVWSKLENMDPARGRQKARQPRSIRMACLGLFGTAPNH